MAGMVAGVYSYDETTGKFTEELNTFPALTFYDNGTVTMGWSHNQGLAGEFWPYTVYQYNADTGAFENVGYVDAWQKEYFEEDWSGNPVPDSVDADGDGFVYFLNGDSDNPADGAEYEAWRNSLFGTANVIEIDEQYLTQENIDGLRR
jgi:hypothetical protein